MNWHKVSDELPEIGDYGLLVYFSEQDSIETVNCEDYFKPITSGLDSNGKQTYTLWAYSQGVTYWMYLPAAPNNT